MRKLSIVLATIFVFGSVNAAGAENFDRVRFVDMIKEYAYKLVIPEIRCKGEKVHAEDMKNLRAQILAMIEDYPESRQALGEVVQNDQEIGGILETDTFTSDLIKFENINNRPTDSCEISYSDIRMSKYHLILRYSHHFNVPPMPKHIRLLTNGTTKSKNVMDEYWSIFDDFNKITDENSLHIIGPPLIQRCENILSRQISNDILPVYAAGDLYDRAALCTIALEYGNPSQIPDELYYSEYTKYVFKTYKFVSIPKYKYASIYTLKSYTWQFNKYEEFLNHTLFVKKDVFNKLDFEDKIGLVSNIVEVVKTNLPPQANYFKIGLENCHDFISLVKYNHDYSDDWKLIYIYNCNIYSIGEIYNKNGCVDEALFELDYVINAKPPSSNTENSFKSMVEYAKKKREEWIVNTDYPYTIDVDIFDVNDESHPIEISDGKTVEVFTKPFITTDGINTNNFKLKYNLVKSTIKSYPPKNLTLEIYFESIFENDDIISAFFHNPKKDNGDFFEFNREIEYGIKHNGKCVKSIILSNIKDSNINIDFEPTSFGGDKFRIYIKSSPPYNINKFITLEVWKKFTLKLYSMDDKFIPNTSGLKEIYDPCYVKFEVENITQKIDQYNLIYTSKTNNVDISKIYILKFIDIMKKNGLIFSQQHDYINIVGCNKIYEYVDENEAEKIWGAYYRHYYVTTDETFLVSLSGEFGTQMPYCTCLMSYGLLRPGFHEIKTLAHEIGHSFALKHPEDDLYIHSDNLHCIMNQTQVEIDHENYYKHFCDHCQYLIRNGTINITETYHMLGEDFK